MNNFNLLKLIFAPKLPACFPLVTEIQTDYHTAINTRVRVGSRNIPKKPDFLESQGFCSNN